MSNGEKAGRVAQLFDVQLQNKFLWKQFYFCFLLTVARFYTDLCICFLSFCELNKFLSLLGLVTFLCLRLRWS
jgi:hypothetical protein